MMTPPVVNQVNTKAHYTFRHTCDSCGSKPVMKTTGMCSVCTFGEASSLWDWLEDGVVQSERKSARRFLDKHLQEMVDDGMVDRNGNIDPIAASLMHLNQEVIERIEAIV